MGKIVQLSEALSNKIAAGEVVERPASVVKELVENSIDAGSTSVSIVVEEAGLRSIRVIDNGEGIAREDVLTAFLRHATSKIRNENDLFRIGTLGFRGEALPSIASVSRFTIKTCVEDESGTHVVIEGGHVSVNESAPSRRGTDIIVENLFYNTPARLKYMKSLSTELSHITDVIHRLALSHPDVRIILKHGDRTILQTSGNGDARSVLASMYGMDIARKMVRIEAESLDYKIAGWMALPEVNRASRTYMSTIVNGRYVKNFALSRAIQDGYHTLLPIGRFPMAYISIEMAPILVDVNVHPSKLEVRFSKEEELVALIRETIANEWKKRKLIVEGTVKKEKKEQEKSVQPSFSFTHQSSSRTTESEMMPRVEQKPIVEQKKEAQPPSEAVLQAFAQQEDTVSTQWGYPIRKSPNVPSVAKDESVSVKAKMDIPFDIVLPGDMDKGKLVEQDERKNVEAIEVHEANEWDEVETRENELPPLYPVGQVHGTYIIAQNENGMYLIDQHAAQERIHYEMFRERVARVANDLQLLLVPIVLQYSMSEWMILNEQRHDLQSIGIFLEDFGHQTFVIRQHPTWFPKGEEQRIIEDILQVALQQKKPNIGKLREEAAIMMSCKASIKANQFLQEKEMFALLESLRTCEVPYTCPHGRPVIIHFSSYDLEKMFKRVM